VDNSDANGDENQESPQYPSVTEEPTEPNVNEDSVSSEDKVQQVEKPVDKIKKPKWIQDYVCPALTKDFVETEVFHKAMESEHKEDWIVAMNSEYNSLMKNNVWEIVDRPENENILKCKWIYKIKKDADEELDKFKARPVARGFAQERGINYNETFSPVV
jgi:hypothetical protein